MFKSISTAAILFCAIAGAAHAQTAPYFAHSDVTAAWAQGYKGQGANIFTVDNFGASSYRMPSRMAGTTVYGTHGEQTSLESALLAPSAKVTRVDYTANRDYRLQLGSGFNVINASYGVMANTGFSADSMRRVALHGSVIDAAWTGTAVVSKAAGNSGIAVDLADSRGQIDYMTAGIVGAPSAIIVGALDKNGSIFNKANMAYYSNTAGNDPTIQRQFLSVGVAGYQIGLQGTSFAAPIVSAYAAIVSSKFQGASPVQVTNQLLNTARTDTIANFNPAVHGRGEASLSRALAPVSIR